MNVCIVSFSGRAGGNCGSIAAALRQRLEEGNTVTVFDFSAFSLTPCGHCHYECFQARENCPYFSDAVFPICDAVTGSDITYFIVPNYDDYPCANFFIFNERSQCYFGRHQSLRKQYLAARKKFIVVSNTGRDNFTAAFRGHVPEGQPPDLLFLSAKQYHKKSLAGDLLDSPEAKEAVFRFLES